MRRISSTILAGSLAFSLSGAALAQGGTTLPLKRVRLYETGVGYFERAGTLAGKAAELPVPASHLDDALKTLVVLSDDAKATVAGVEFGSSVSRGMARALAGLPSDDTPLKLHSLLRSMKGANVQIKTSHAGAITGRLVELVEAADSDLEECIEVSADGNGSAHKGCVMQKQPTVVVLTKGGELRRLRVADLVSVKPTDPGFASRLGSALDALGDRSMRTLKDLRVLAKSGKGITLGYVAETPVWRVTYRLVLTDAKKDSGALQGWALLHNDTDEDWRGVQVDLVNGRPDSFLFPLAAPRYARRELVTPDNELSTVPQLMGTTPDAMWGDEGGDSYGAGGLGLSGVGEGGGGRGEGIGLGSIGTIGHGAGTGNVDSASSLLSVGNLAGVSGSEGVEAGALFRYTLKQAVDLRAHGSALVPFLSDGIVARRMAFFSAANTTARSAVHLTHQGKQTLPPGTIAVFSDGGFAGEAALPRLKPKETSVVEFGEDLDVELDQESADYKDETKLLSYRNGTLKEHFVRHHVVRYELENRSGSGRAAFLKLAYVNNAKVTGADELSYDSHAGRALAVFDIGPQTKATRTLKVDEGLSRDHDAKKLTSRSLRALLAGKAIPKRQREIAMAASDRLIEAEVRRGAYKKWSAELKVTRAEAARLREHIRAVGAARGGEELVKRLLAAEDRQKELGRRLVRLKTEAAEKERLAQSTLARLGG
jgi:hypothetical protein